MFVVNASAQTCDHTSLYFEQSRLPSPRSIHRRLPTCCCCQRCKPNYDICGWMLWYDLTERKISSPAYIYIHVFIFALFKIVAAVLTAEMQCVFTLHQVYAAASYRNCDATPVPESLVSLHLLPQQKPPPRLPFHPSAASQDPMCSDGRVGWRAVAIRLSAPAPGVLAMVPLVFPCRHDVWPGNTAPWARSMSIQETRA
jgi:hypothetical protein